MSRRSVWMIAALLMVAGASSQALAQNAGKVTAVNPQSTGTPPSAATRVLTLGAGVVHKERINTSAQGSAQILFPDSSTLNVGRNSSVVIDEYVYDPNAGAGRMAVSLGKGVMRFVGGQISHTSGATFKTPAATLGVRGGVVTIVYPVPPSIAGGNAQISACRGQLAVGHFGSITLRNNSGQVRVRPGFAACVTGPDDPIPQPVRISDATLQAVMALITSGPGQHGGAIRLPTDGMAARLGLGRAILDDPARPPGVDPLGRSGIIGAGNALGRNKAQSNQLQNGSIQRPPNNQTPPPGNSTRPPPGSQTPPGNNTQPPPGTQTPPNTNGPGTSGPPGSTGHF